jgi:hypothetical protein
VAFSPFDTKLVAKSRAIFLVSSKLFEIMRIE